MDKLDRIFQLHAVLNKRRTPISFDELKERMQCSKATLHRTIKALENHLRAPLVFDKKAGGYRYNTKNSQYELPGLWFTEGELQALVTIQRLLSELGEGLLDEHFSLLNARILELTSKKHLNLSEVATRIRMPALAARPTGPAFQNVVGATLQRKKLWIEYRARTSDQPSARTISPQRVTRYRESWYLDAWDEDKQGLRTFAIDRIGKHQALAARARDIDENSLDEHFSSGYGIFSGNADKVAVLCFSAERARWVADEQWHHKQEGKFLPDGRYELRIPYGASRELVMDILRHGPHVKVMAPESLAQEVMEQAALTLRQYGDANST